MIYPSNFLAQLLAVGRARGRRLGHRLVQQRVDLLPAQRRPRPVPGRPGPRRLAQRHARRSLRRRRHGHPGRHLVLHDRPHVGHRGGRRDGPRLRPRLLRGDRLVPAQPGGRLPRRAGARLLRLPRRPRLEPRGRAGHPRPHLGPGERGRSSTCATRSSAARSGPSPPPASSRRRGCTAWRRSCAGPEPRSATRSTRAGCRQRRPTRSWCAAPSPPTGWAARCRWTTWVSGTSSTTSTRSRWRDSLKEFFGGRAPIGGQPARPWRPGLVAAGGVRRPDPSARELPVACLTPRTASSPRRTT